MAFNIKESIEEITLQRKGQAASVVRILNTAIEKLKLSFLVPHILENPITIHEQLRNTKYKKFLRLLGAYIKELNCKNVPPPHLNYTLIKLIDYLHHNCKILEALPNWVDDLPSENKNILEAFQLLKKLTEDRLKKSALSELKKESEMHEMYHANVHLRKEIERLEKQLNSQRITLRWKLSAKQVVIKKYKEELAFRKYDNSVQIKREIITSSRNMRQINATSILRQKEMQEELQRTKANYEKMLKDHLKLEKIAKDEKNKLLIQLVSLIKKYNQTIHDKLEENAKLQEEYDREKASFDEFMIEYNREEEEYIRLVKSKEDEEKRIQQSKIWIFMMRRAAKIIQRAWRRFMKAKKKKAKAARKGKK